MAFENISKGIWSIDEDRVKENKHGVSVIPLRIDNCPEHYSSACNVVRVYEPDGNLDNAEFIAFCFNLQQRYDISKFEEAVKLLELFNNAFDIKYAEIEQLLKEIKK